MPVFFVIGTITAWRPLLLENQPWAILLGDLDFYRTKYGCGIVAYVIMPKHCHLVLHLRKRSDLHRWPRDVQPNSNRLILIYAEDEGRDHDWWQMSRACFSRI
jgi:hypothetical protein